MSDTRDTGDVIEQLLRCSELQTLCDETASCDICQDAEADVSLVFRGFTYDAPISEDYDPGACGGVENDQCLLFGPVLFGADAASKGCSTTEGLHVDVLNCLANVTCGSTGLDLTKCAVRPTDSTPAPAASTTPAPAESEPDTRSTTTTPAPESSTTSTSTTPAPESSTTSTSTTPAPESSTTSTDSTPAPAESDTRSTTITPAPESSTTSTDTTPAPESTTGNEYTSLTLDDDVCQAEYDALSACLQDGSCPWCWDDRDQDIDSTPTDIAPNSPFFSGPEFRTLADFCADTGHCERFAESYSVCTASDRWLAVVQCQYQAICSAAGVSVPDIGACAAGTVRQSDNAAAGRFPPLGGYGVTQALSATLTAVLFLKGLRFGGW